MEISRLSCRLCLSVTDFNVSLFGTYCRKTNMLDKILVCLKLVIEETDHLHTICYKCAESIERFYDFIAFVKKTQTKLCNNNRYDPKGLNDDPQNGVNRRHITSYVREQVFDADYTFSFLEMSQNEEKKEKKVSSPFFSYFSPPNVVLKPEPRAWKTPRPRCDDIQKTERKSQFEKPNKIERPRQLSRDLFESQSQDAEDAEPRYLNSFQLTPDKSIIRRVREKCFGPSDF